MQGEAGVVVPSDGYLKKAHDICKKYNVLLIAVSHILCSVLVPGILFARLVFHCEAPEPVSIQNSKRCRACVQCGCASLISGVLAG